MTPDREGDVRERVEEICRDIRTHTLRVARDSGFANDDEGVIPIDGTFANRILAAYHNQLSETHRHRSDHWMAVAKHLKGGKTINDVFDDLPEHLRDFLLRVARVDMDKAA